MSKRPEKCMCGKISYKTESQAKTYAESKEKQYNKPHRVYKCLWCPNFALTTKVQGKGK